MMRAHFWETFHLYLNSVVDLWSYRYSIIKLLVHKNRHIFLTVYTDLVYLSYLEMSYLKFNLIIDSNEKERNMGHTHTICGSYCNTAVNHYRRFRSKSISPSFVVHVSKCQWKSKSDLDIRPCIQLAVE